MRTNIGRSFLAVVITGVIILSPIYLISVCASLSEDLVIRYSYDTRLSDIDRDIYREALLLRDENEFEEALKLLNRINNPYSQEEYLLLHTELLFLSGFYSEVFTYIDNLPGRMAIKLFDELIEYYIISAINEDRYDKITDFIELQRRFYPDSIHDIYKKTLYALLRSENYQQVIDLTDVFPNEIYNEGEKNFILGVAYFNLERYSIAGSFMENVLASGTQLYQEVAYEYLSLISYILQAPEMIPDSTQSLTDTAKSNFIITLLEQNMIDEASRLALLFEDEEIRTYIDLFIAWESGHYKTAQTIMTSLTDEEFARYPLLNLVSGEILYYSNQFREAETKFRKYLSFEEIDEEYANHAIGYCFMGYYRYNSTAYYWIKNLEPAKSLYDSLAAINLSKLYTHTENYHSARYYFDYYLQRYSIPQNDHQFIRSYFTTLENTEDFPAYEAFYEKYGNEFSSQERFAMLNLLGEYHLEEDEKEKAIQYFEEALEYKKDHNTILKLEKLRFALGEYRDSEEFVLSYLEKYPDNRYNKQLAHDLAKFYLNQNQYYRTINFIDSFLDSLSPEDNRDSLHYYSAMAYKELRNSERALNIFLSLHQNSDNASIKRNALQQIESILVNQEPRKSIDFLVDLIDVTDDEEIGFDYLSVLAIVYERAFLYNQANEIYHMLLELDQRSEKDKLYYQLAVNSIYQKQYEEALSYIELILATGNSKYHEDALFLSNLAYYSLDQYTESIRTLLILYHDYPDFSKRFEVIRNLLEILMELELDIFAFHYLQDYYPEASRTEQFTLDNYSERMKQSIKDDTALLYQIIEIRQLLEQTLRTLEKT